MKSTDIDWAEAQRIARLPEICGAIHGLVNDSTEDNAVCVVREVMAVLMTQAADAALKMWQEGYAEGFAAPVCTVPPEGWRCTRTDGHEGPCAAWPTKEPK